MTQKRKYDFTVECPKNAIFIPVKGQEYVYINLEKFKKPGKKGYQYVRRSIGKSVDRKVMYPNDMYYQLFPELESFPVQSGCLNIGVPLVIENVAKSSGLLECLEDFIGEKGARETLDLATYTMLTRSDSYQHFYDYAFNIALQSGRKMSDSTISRFLSQTLTPTVTSAFTKEWARMKSKDVTAYIYLSLDSTNVNTKAEGIELAQLGFAKDDPDIPQVNFELVIRQKDNLPIYYKVYPGSLVDVNQLEDVVKLLKSLGFEKIVIVADRGYISRKNIKILDEQGIDFLFLLKDCARTEELIEKYGRKIVEKAEYYLPEHEAHGMTVRHRLFDNMGPVRSLHIVWKPKIKESEKRRLLDVELPDKARKLEAAVESNERWHGTRLKNYRKYFDIETDKDNRILSFKRNNKLINKAIEKLGFQVYVSSLPLETEQTLDIYTMRNGIERSFEGLKSLSGMDVLRGHSDENIEGRFFIYFIDAILRSLIAHYTLKLKKISKKHYTIPSILNELSNLKAFKDQGAEFYCQRYVLTKQQKDILSCFNISESEVKDYVKRYSIFVKSFQKKQAE